MTALNILKICMQKRCHSSQPTPENLKQNKLKADVFISTILIPGAKPPKLVTP